MIKLNNHIINVTVFPDKTSQVWKINTSILEHTVNCIKWDFENEGEFLQVAQLVDLIRSLSKARITLWMEYLPYARQDKEVSNATTFALPTFCKLLDSLNVDHIVTVDVHSDVPKKLLKTNFTNLVPLSTIERIADKLNTDYIVCPDKGATARYSTQINYPFITMNKERNQLTGELKMSGVVEKEVNLSNKSVLIVDDICDGGGTFILAAKELHRLGVKEVNLYVSHGIFSKGTTILEEAGIKNIYTKDGKVLD